MNRIPVVRRTQPGIAGAEKDELADAARLDLGFRTFEGGVGAVAGAVGLA